MAGKEGRRWFGTDGIRGRVGKEPMTPEFVAALGEAAGRYFSKKHPRGKILIARDTRESGRMLEAALISGIRSAGLEAEAIGVIPSGAAAMVGLQKGACGVAVLSASHNPATDNGIKFFGSDGGKLGDSEEEVIEGLLNLKKTPVIEERKVAEDFSCEPEAFDLYRKRLEGIFGRNFSLKGLKILVDAANGAAWFTTPEILRGLGSEVEVMGVEPNGENINEGCGSEHPEKLMEAVRKRSGWIGLAHDGDADRLVLVDEDGKKVDGDEVIAMAAMDALERGKLSGKTVVVTVMSNLGLDEMVTARGGKVVRTAVGDRYVAEAMRKGGFGVGGEQSGHLLFLEDSPAGDGLLSALKILDMAARKKKRLAELRKEMRKYPQQLTNLKVRHKPAWETVEPVARGVREAEDFLGKKGRVLLRYSGTENLVRLLVEADEIDKLQKVQEKLVPILKEHLGEK